MQVISQSVFSLFMLLSKKRKLVLVEVKESEKETWWSPCLLSGKFVDDGARYCLPEYVRSLLLSESLCI